MTTTLVYRYGLHAPYENADLVHEQMRLAHQYRNTLTEIERGRRAAVRAVEAEHGDMPAALQRLAQARIATEAAVREVTQHRARTHKRDESPEMKAKLREARGAERDAARAFRELRAVLKGSPEMVAARDTIGERAKELHKSARAHCGVYWGTYQLVEDAASDAFTDTPMYSDGAPNDPRFARRTGNGAVGVQLQGGLSIDEATGGGDTRLRLQLPDPRAWSGARSDRRRYGSTAKLAIRVGSDEQAKPVWAGWVLDMDRPLPQGAQIQRVDVHRAERGPHAEWYAIFTLRLASDAPYARKGAGAARIGGTVALDVGWRVMGEELRVAAWKDDRGEGGELRLSPAVLGALREPEAIRAERDRRFNAARGALATWLGAHEAPAWVVEVCRMMHAWRSPARLVDLWRRWGLWLEENDGDESAYDALTSWYWRDRHEWACEARRRTRALRRRRELYRIFAAKLASDYDTIVLERFDLRTVAVRPRAADAENEAARSNRQLAAVSELRAAIAQAARSRGRVVVAMPAEDTTRTCPACGLVEKRDAAASVVLSCECGHVWDQDTEGAAPLLLARWRERPGDAKVQVGAREEKDAENRWQRAKRLRVEKEVRIATAREAEAGGAQ